MDLSKVLSSRFNAVSSSEVGYKTNQFPCNTFTKINYNTAINTTKYILRICKLNHNEDQQDERAKRTAHKLINQYKSEAILQSFNCCCHDKPDLVREVSTPFK